MKPGKDMQDVIKNYRVDTMCGKGMSCKFFSVRGADFDVLRKIRTKI